MGGTAAGVKDRQMHVVMQKECGNGWGARGGEESASVEVRMVTPARGRKIRIVMGGGGGGGEGEVC